MNYPLTNNQEILLILNRLNSIQEINQYILFLKNKIEKQETLQYHIHLYENISLKYFISLEKCERPYSYVLNSKYYISEKDRCLDFYNETGISYQVRSLLLEILNCSSEFDGMKLFSDHILNCELYKWREEDDKLYCILARKINEKMKLQIDCCVS